MAYQDETRHPPHNKKWYRLGLAMLLAFILLFIPVTVKTIIQIPVSAHLQPKPLTPASSSQLTEHKISLFWPFGVTLIQAAEGLTITKSAPSVVNQGEALTYTLTITNNTGSSITSGFVVDPLPDNVSCDDGNVDPSSDWVTFACNNDPPSPFALFSVPSGSPFANGTTVNLIYSVDVTQPLTDGYQIVNTGYFIDPDAPDLDPSFGSPVTTTVNAPSWAITKTVSSSVIQPNQTLVYTITATNIGHLVTSGAYFITDTLPNSTTFSSASPGASLAGSVLTWSFSNSLAALGGTRTVTYSVTVNSPLDPGVTIVNDDYTVYGGNAYSSATNEPITVTVTSPASLAISKTASPTSVKIGEYVTYTLTITNISATGPAQGVVITDDLPSQVTFDSAAFLSGSGSITPGDPTVWTLASPLSPNGTVQLRLTAQVNTIALPTPALITNTFEAAGSNTPLASGSMTVGVVAGAPAAITVTSDSTSLDICETTPITAAVVDAAGNPVPGVAVTLQTLGPITASTILPPTSGVTNQNGLFVTTLKATNGPAPNARAFGEIDGTELQDSSPFINISTNTVPDQISLTVLPNPLPIGGSTAVVTATVQDCLGGPKASQPVTFTLSNTSLATFPPPPDNEADGVTNTNGQAAASLTSGSIVGTLTITGVSGSLQDVITLDLSPAPQPALTMAKTASPASGANVTPESTINYTVQVTNTGSANAANVVLTDTLPAGVGFVNVVSSTTGAGSITGPTFPSGNVLVLSLSQLEANGGRLSATIQVTVTTTVSGTTLNNQASAKSNTTSEITSNIVTHRVITPPNTGVFLPLIFKQ
jgi:uncharacterized repeat protein (TIGR01451 family)